MRGKKTGVFHKRRRMKGKDDEFSFFPKKEIKRTLRRLGLFGPSLELVQFLQVPGQLSVARRLGESGKLARVDTEGRCVLFWLVRGLNIIPIFIESILAKALQLRGHRVKMLLCNKALSMCATTFTQETGSQLLTCSRCCYFGHSFLDALDLPVENFDRFLRVGERQEITELVGKLSESQLQTYEVDGIRIGHHAFQSALRYFEGALAKPERFARVLREEAVNAIVSLRTAQEVHRQLRPDVVVTSHGCYAPWGPVFDYFEKVGVEVHVYGLNNYDFNTLAIDRFKIDRDDTVFRQFLVERRSEHLTPQEDALLERFLQRRQTGQQGDVALFLGKRGTSTGQAEMEEIKRLNRPIFGLFSNLPWDARLVSWNTIFPGVYDWIETTIRAFTRQGHGSLIIKPHPVEVLVQSRRPMDQFVRERFGELPSTILLLPANTGISPYDLLQEIDATLVYDGTIGLESVLMGVPAIVAGKAHYAGSGFTHEPASVEAYEAMLAQAPPRQSEDKMQRARTYAYFYFIKSFVPFPLIQDAYLGHFREYEVSDLEELLPGKNRFLDHLCESLVQGKPVFAWE